jgi:hypothetical protein
MGFVQEEMNCPGIPAVVRCGRCGKSLTNLKSQIAGLGSGCSRITKGQPVIGNNTILLNDQTMIKAVEHYLNTVVLSEQSKVKVTFVKQVNPGQTQVSIVSPDPEAPDGPH